VACTAETTDAVKVSTSVLIPATAWSYPAVLEFISS